MNKFEFNQYMKSTSDQIDLKYFTEIGCVLQYDNDVVKSKMDAQYGEILYFNDWLYFPKTNNFQSHAQFLKENWIITKHYTIEDSEVFVFGSNEAGYHGKGAAATARHFYGAKKGVGNGMQGIGSQGTSYGIPTKDGQIKTLPLRQIRKYVDQFIEFAEQHPEMRFFVTAIGTGLAGYKHEEIAPMFCNAKNLKNVRLPPEWSELC